MKDDSTTPPTFTYILGGDASAYYPNFTPFNEAWLQGITGYLKDNGQFAIFTPTAGGVELAGYGISFNGNIVLNNNHELLSKLGDVVVDQNAKYYDKNGAKILDVQQAGVTHPTIAPVTTIAQADAAIQTLCTKLNAALSRLEAHGLIATGGH